MRARYLPLLAVFAIVVSACAGADQTVDTTGATGPSTSVSGADTTLPGEETTRPSTDTTVETTGTTSDRPLAPDFTLELGDGGTYQLSAGDKPVYLVFWAEW